MLRQRYRESTKHEKGRILDEFVAVAKCHRKHAVRLLGQETGESEPRAAASGRRIYDEAVREALVVVWEAGDRICGKRLKAILPTLTESLERHGHFDLAPIVRERLSRVSAATIDRMLAPIRHEAGQRKRRRARKQVSKQVPTRTYQDWNEPSPGYLEVDFVAHCGGSMAGNFIHSLVATDVCSGWTEAVPMLAREQSLVTEGIDVIAQRLPVPVAGIDTDNDSAFINETLVGYCERRQFEFTRSRAYRKNDQAWIEQKNGAVIRRFVGHERYCGSVAGQALAHLYAAVRLYVNYFQPSFKLVDKTREGSKVAKRYDKPTTPCDRLLAHPSVNKEVKEALQEKRLRLDPVELLHRIREAQLALADVASQQLAAGSRHESFEQFLSQLPRLWRRGEVRPTHSKRVAKPRYWRTRKDPFEGVWSEVLLWLQQEPDATAKSLFEDLRVDYPGRFGDGQLRTLQRRLKEWRAIMARKLVYACLEGTESEVAAIGADS
ncbi:MAG: integrase catalytic domain-containing protein [Vicinamibacteria bacterium]